MRGFDASARFAGTAACCGAGLRGSVFTRTEPCYEPTLVVFALKHSGNVIPLRTSLVVGRSPACDLVFQSGRISRRHAEFSVDGGVVVTDLDSANGVFVNGVRISAPRRLEEGDQILVGDVVLELIGLEEPNDEDEEARDTRIGISPPTMPGSMPYDDREPDSTVPGSKTQKGDAIAMLGNVADKMLAQGQVDAAERLLSGRISSLLEETEAGVMQSESVISSATTYALKLARASRKPSWIDLLFRLYAKLGRPMPLHAIDELYELVRVTSGMRADALREYLETLDARRERFSPTERFALQRLVGLRKLIAAQ